MTVSRTLAATRPLASSRVIVSGRGKPGNPVSPPPTPGNPVISNIAASSITQTSVVLSWDIDQFCQAYVEYGPTTGYGSSNAPGETSFTYKSHVQSISGLTSDITYHYRVHVTNAGGLSTVSGDNTFATLPATPPVDPPPGGGPNYIQTVTGPASGTIASVQSAINGMLDGTDASNHRRLLLPAGATYTGANGLSLAGRAHITIEGGGTFIAAGNTNGATLNVTGLGTSTATCPFLCTGANDVRIIGINAIGSNPYGATNLSWNGTVSWNGPPYTRGESQHGVAMYGGTNVEVGYCTFRNLQGDGFYLGDGGAQTNGFWWHNNTVDKNGRMGCVLKHSNNVTVEDSVFTDISMYVWDFEPSYNTSVMSNTIFRRNTVGNYGWSTAFGNSFVIGLAADGGIVPTYNQIICDNNIFNGDNKGSPTNIAGLFDFRHATFNGPLFIRNNIRQAPRLQKPGWGAYLNVGTGAATITNNTGFLSSGAFVLIGGYAGMVTQSGNS